MGYRRRNDLFLTRFTLPRTNNVLSFLVLICLFTEHFGGVKLLCISQGTVKKTRHSLSKTKPLVQIDFIKPVLCVANTKLRLPFTRFIMRTLTLALNRASPTPIHSPNSKISGLIMVETTPFQLEHIILPLNLMLQGR